MSLDALTMGFMERPQIAALVMSNNPAPSVKVSSSPADPLAPIAGKSILGWVVDALLGASVRRIAVVQRDPLLETRGELASRSDRAMIELISSTRDLADSVSFALERIGSELLLRDSAHVLVVPAESPQIETHELRELIDTHVASGAAATLISSQAPLLDGDADPVVVRDADGKVISIVEPGLSAPGLLCINASMLVPAIRRIDAPSWQQTIPLDDVVRVLDEMGHVVSIHARHEPLAMIWSAASRTPIQRSLRDRIIAGWIDRGTSIPDPNQVSIDATASLGQGVQVLPGSVIEGSSVIGDGAVIGPNTHLIDALIGAAAQVPHSVVTGAEVPARGSLPPFSVVRGRADA